MPSLVSPQTPREMDIIEQGSANDAWFQKSLAQFLELDYGEPLLSCFTTLCPICSLSPKTTWLFFLLRVTPLRVCLVKNSQILCFILNYRCVISDHAFCIQFAMLEVGPVLRAAALPVWITPFIPPTRLLINNPYLQGYVIPRQVSPI